MVAHDLMICYCIMSIFLSAGFLSSLETLNLIFFVLLGSFCSRLVSCAGSFCMHGLRYVLVWVWSLGGMGWTGGYEGVAE